MAATDVTRIALYLPDLGGAGAQRVSVTLAHAFAQRDIAVDIVLVRAEGAYLAEASADARVIDLGAHRAIASLPRLVRYLRRERPDAMVSAMAHLNIVALWARRLARVSTRLIVSEHNTASKDQSQQAKSRGAAALLRRFYSWAELKRDFYGWADGIIAVSEGVADDLAQTAHLPRERITVIYNPVVSPELLDQARQDPQDRWFAPDQPPVVLSVGRLTAQKDYPTLLRAFALLRERREARLLILGEGEARAQLEQLVRSLGLEAHVRLPGWVHNPYAYMARAAVFVLSSAWEGLPTVLIEAMACGCPVVSTDCPSGPAEILALGRWGKLVPVADSHALAAAVDAALQSRPPRAPAEAYSPFMAQTAACRYLEMLRG